MSTAKNHQCECCASPLGDLVQLDGTQRIICNQCLGFMARWLIELDSHEALKPQEFNCPPLCGQCGKLHYTNQSCEVKSENYPCIHGVTNFCRVCEERKGEVEG